MDGHKPLLSYDLGELNDLSKQHPNIAKRMTELMKPSRTKMLPQAEPERPKGKKYR